MNLDIQSVMKALSAQRKVFHSEADFQHAFAWELHLRQPEASIRLEKPLRTASKNLHLDFLFEHAGKSVAVELKYKTRSLKLSMDGEDSRYTASSLKLAKLQDAWLEGWRVLLSSCCAFSIFKRA